LNTSGAVFSQACWLNRQQNIQTMQWLVCSLKKRKLHQDLYVIGKGVLATEAKRSERKVAYHCFTLKYSGKGISFLSVFVFVCCNFE